MGYDIHLYCEGFLPKYRHNRPKEWINIDHWFRSKGIQEYTINEEIGGFDYIDLINHNRDYQLFYLLAGVCGNKTEQSYPPISEAKGLPNQMDVFIIENDLQYYNIDVCKNNTADAHHASYLTLDELKKSGYGEKMPLKGWVHQNEYDKAMTAYELNEQYQLHFADVKSKHDKGDMVFKEWNGYLNLNLTHMLERMEALKKERGIDSDKDIRIVFWFDN